MENKINMITNRNGGRLHFLMLAFMLFITAILDAGCNKEEIKFPTVIPPDDTDEQYDIPFDNVPTPAEIVMYEVNLRAFSASGNLKGVQARLDSIKNLGINVIWLMPIYPIGVLKGIGSPYAVRNYKEVNADYGTLADLRELVKQAHQRDMAVILDWVGNHTAWDNPWISNKAWYTQDAGGNILSPQTWTDVADLNFDSQAMRKEMIKAMKYWVLEANVDGYRCDYAEGVPDDFWKAAIDTLQQIPNRDIIMFAEARSSTLLNAGFDMTFGWNFYEKLKAIYNQNVPVSELASVHTADYNGIPQGTQIVRWITNHDDNAWDNTPMNIFKTSDGAMAAFVLSSYMGGVPLVYSGQEVGCPIQLSFFKGGNTKIDWTKNAGTTDAYKKLINFRRESDAIQHGSLQIMNSNPDILIFKRTSGAEEVVVMVNVRDREVTHTLPAALNATSWVNALNGADVAMGTSIVMSPFQYLVLRNQ